MERSKVVKNAKPCTECGKRTRVRQKRDSCREWHVVCLECSALAAEPLVETSPDWALPPG